MTHESKTPSYSVAPTPSYAEAMELSPRHITPVKVDQQQISMQENSAKSPNDPDDVFANELRKKKRNKIICLIIQLSIVIFLIFILLYFL